MLYSSVNELDCFQFHDAEIKEIKLVEANMIWFVYSINAMTTNTQNNVEKDMCIKEATMIFENIAIEKLEYGAYKVYDSNHKLIDSSEAEIKKAEEYANILAESTSSYCYIFGMDELIKVDDGTYHIRFDINGGAGSYYLTFTFSKAIVEWNEYSGEAWYEDPKWKKK